MDLYEFRARVWAAHDLAVAEKTAQANDAANALDCEYRKLCAAAIRRGEKVPGGRSIGRWVKSA